MAQFDLSVIKTFTLPGDTVNFYVMIDASIVTAAKVGLTAAQKAVIDSYVWVPAEADFANGCPAWAGGDPASVYFRTTQLKAQTALARWYK